MTPAETAPLVVVISGPSGVGKDTVIEAALALDESLAKVATAKTRAPRAGEIDGVHHVFLSELEFDRWLTDGAFLEHAQVYGHRSGVPRRAVDELLAQGRTPLLRTDVQGARTLKANLDDPLLVFITVPHLGELERRMRERGTESDEEIGVRLAEAEAEIAEAAWFDAVIVNDRSHHHAAQALVERIEAERAARRLTSDGDRVGCMTGTNTLEGGHADR